MSLTSCYVRILQQFQKEQDEREPILGKKFMGYASGNLSDFERQKQGGSTATDYNAADKNDEIHQVMMEVEPLLEASGKGNWRSIMLTHDEFSCRYLLQTWWYSGRSIHDSEPTWLHGCTSMPESISQKTAECTVSAYQLDIASGAFKRALVTHRNAVTTTVKRTSRTSD